MQELTDRTIFDYLGINFISTFEHSENRYLALGPSSSDSAYTTRSEVAPIEFNLTVGEGTF